MCLNSRSSRIERKWRKKEKGKACSRIRAEGHEEKHEGPLLPRIRHHFHFHVYQALSGLSQDMRYTLWHELALDRLRYTCPLGFREPFTQSTLPPHLSSFSRGSLTLVLHLSVDYHLSFGWQKACLSPVDMLWIQLLFSKRNQILSVLAYGNIRAYRSIHSEQDCKIKLLIKFNKVLVCLLYFFPWPLCKLALHTCHFHCHVIIPIECVMSVYWYFIKPRDSENPSDHVCNIPLLRTPAAHNILLMNTLNSKADTHFVGSNRFRGIGLSL